MAFSAPRVVGFQQHHIIPQALADHKIFGALGSVFDIDDVAENMLNLPESNDIARALGAAMAADEEVIIDGVHRGGHPQYTNMVESVLDDIWKDYKDNQGVFLEVSDPDERKMLLKAEIEKYQYFLKDALTAQVDEYGNTIGPKIHLNNADTRAVEATDGRVYGDRFYQEHYNSGFDFGSYAAVKETPEFKSGAILNKTVKFNEILEDGRHRVFAAETTYLKQTEIKKLLGWSGFSLSGADMAALEKKLPDLRKTLDNQAALTEAAESIANNTRSGNRFVEAMPNIGKLLHGKSAVVAAGAIIVTGLISSDEAFAAELYKEIDPELVSDLAGDTAWSIAEWAFETALLTLATGGAGTVAKFVIDAKDAVELLTLTVEILDIIYPEWGLMDTLAQVSENITKIAISIAEEVADAAGFEEFIIVDTSEAEDGSAVELDVTGSSKADLVWARGDNKVNVNTGDGKDWVFHTGQGEVNAGGGDDFIFANNSATGMTREEASHLMIIDAGSGDDFVLALGPATIYLGEGNDAVMSSGKGSVIDLGPGGSEDKDDVIDARGSLIVGADGYDTVRMFGLSVAGLYTRNADSESPWANGLLFQVTQDTDGNWVIRFVTSGDEDYENYIYLANANVDASAAPSQLTAGIRAVELEHTIWTIRGDYPSLGGDMDQWDVIRLWLKDIDFRANIGGVDPLVLDLDGDGIELSAFADTFGPAFDMDGDNFLEYTGWVAPDDGFLTYDSNNNGLIDGISELFGGAGQSGFAALSEYDDNGDGVIDASDSVFGDLKVWRDLDRDAVTDEGELFTLGELDINSINLDSTDVNEVVASNNVVRTGTFTFQDGTTGVVGDIEFRVNNFASQYMGDITVSESIAATMPNLRGRGTLADLHVSLTLDEASGALAEVVNRVMPTLNTVDLDVLSERAFEIFEAWMASPPMANQPDIPNKSIPALIKRDAGQLSVLDFAMEVTEQHLIEDEEGTQVLQDVTYWKTRGGTTITDGNGVAIRFPTYEQLMAHVSDDPDAQWEVISSKELDFLERYFGEQVPLDDAENLMSYNLAGVNGLLGSAEQVVEQLAVRLAAQGGLKEYFVGIEYSVEEDIFVATTNEELIPMFRKIFEATPQDVGGATAWLDGWHLVMKTLLSDFQRSGSGPVNKPFLFTNIVAAYESVGLSISLADAAEILGISKDIVDYGSGERIGTTDGHIYYMTSGDDTVVSKTGTDVFVFGENFGHDVIDDYEANSDSFDVIRFAHLTASDVVATREGLDLVITVVESGDSVRVIGQFHEMGYALNGGSNVLPSQGVEEIVFADGTVWSLTDIAIAVSHPQDSDETVIGTDHIDYLDGGLGNDYLSGGDNSDIYVFGAGYGNDIFDEKVDTVNSPQEDFVFFNDDVKFEDLTFYREGESKDVEIRLSSGDKFKIIDQFESIYTGILGTVSAQRIEYFNFKAGSEAQNSFTYEDLMKNVIAQYSTDGDDFIYGFDFDDKLDGKAGNDFLSGGNDSDTYAFGKGYGRDTIYEYQSGYNVLSKQEDRIIFNDDVDILDVSVARSANLEDLVFRLSDGSSLTVQEQFSANSFGSHHYQIENFEFVDGTVWTVNDIKQKLLINSLGDDDLIGFWSSDTLDGQAGNDFLSGQDGDDTYVFGYGYGHDTIFDNVSSVLSGETDTVKFKDVAAISELSFVLSNEGKDLTVSLSDGSSLLVKQAFDTGVNFNCIELFEFSDGSILTNEDIRQEIVRRQTSDASDQIVGTNLSETIEAGAGDDFIKGGTASDTYVYMRGDGKDTISEDAWAGGEDKLLMSDIRSDEVTVHRKGDDLVLVIAESSVGADDAGTVRLVNSLETNSYLGVDLIEFSDGVVWEKVDYLSKVTNLDGEDQVILGSSAADTLTGGLGDDDLEGKAGSDTYRYTLGDGNDLITDTDASDTAVDELVLIGIEAAQVSLSATQDGDLLIVMPDGAIVTIAKQLNSSNDGIERIRFEDGSAWDRSEIFEQYCMTTSTDENDLVYGAYISETLNGLSGDDVLQGNSGDDILIGGQGNDVLEGGFGADTFEYSLGDGKDAIFEIITSSNDLNRIVLHAITPDDVAVSRGFNGDLVLAMPDGGMITVNEQFRKTAIQEVVFDDGTVWHADDLASMSIETQSTIGSDVVHGTNLTDEIEGGLGDDFLEGNGNSDTYIYNLGDGHDTVHDNQTDTGEIDKLVIHGVTKEEISVSRDHQNSLVIGLPDGGTILIEKQFGSSSWGIEEVVFDDGSVVTRAELFAIYFEEAKTIDTDVIEGSREADTIVGGLGDDKLVGGFGDDTYIYALGDGNDAIWEGLNNTSDIDRLVLQNISPDDVIVSSNEHRSLLLELPDGSVIEAVGQFDAISYGLEEILFDDGTVWSKQEILDLYLSFASTDESDEILGSYMDDTIEAGLGDDVISGQEGSDTYIYNLGDGNDIIADLETSVLDNDVLSLKGVAPNEVTFSRGSDYALIVQMPNGETVTILKHFETSERQGVESIVFEDGTRLDRSDIDELVNTSTDVTLSGTDSAETLIGTNEDDIIEGLEGDDTLVGKAGNDTYVFAKGDGSDTIDEQNSSTLYIDTLKLVDVYSQDVKIERNGNDLKVTILSTSEILTVNNQFEAMTSFSGIEKIRFADGSKWDRDEIFLKALMIEGDENANTLTGASGKWDEQLVGYAGNDVLNGGKGSDTYLYALGDGQDVIEDRDYSSSAIDTISLTGIAPDQITLSRGAGDDLIISMPDGGSITIKQQFYDQYSGVEQLVFDDGTVWGRNAIFTQYFSDVASDGDDTIVGSYSEDTIAGGLGNDALDGGKGSDTYLYALGDGQDVIEDRDYSSSAVDTIELVGIASDQITLSRGAGDDLIISMPDGGSITIKQQFYDQYSGVEQLVFDDGTVWDRNAIFAQYFSDVASDGDDPIEGGYSNDTIAGGLGNDALDGGKGSDTYLYALGDGQDVIEDRDYSSSAVDTIALVGIASDQITLSRGAGDDLIISMPDGGSITIKQQFYDQYSGIEQMVFEDGTVWDRSAIFAQYFSNAASDSDDPIEGGYSNDTIAGGLGNDALDGGKGSDTYHYTLGDGRDLIADLDYSSSNIDKLLLHGVDFSQVILSSGNDNDVVLSLPDGGAITLSDQKLNNYHGIEEVHFDDGTVWTRQQFMSLLVAGASEIDDPSNGTYVIGTENPADRFVINAHSSDYSWAQLDEGTGIFVWKHGDYENHDILWDIDFLQFNDQVFSLWGGYKERVIAFDDPLITEYPGGTTGVEDTYRINGNSFQYNWAQLDDGSGLYVWQHDNYDSHDVIFDFERIKFDDREVVLTGGYEERLISFDTFGVGEYVVGSLGHYDIHIIDDNASAYNWEWTELKNGFDVWLGDDYDNRDVLFDIESIQFNDQIVTLIHHGDRESQTIRGHSGDWDEAVIGHGGDDHLYGYGGDDLFVFGSSDGNDVIEDFVAGAGTDDVIEFHNISGFDSFASVLNAATDQSNDTLITIDTDNSILIKNVSMAELHQDDFRFV